MPKTAATPDSLPRYIKPEWLTPEEVEAQKRISIHLLRKMRMRGVGPRFKRLGYRSILYRADELDRWLASLPGGGSDRANARTRD